MMKIKSTIRAFCLLLTAALFFGVISAPSLAASPMGDANGDEKINISDASLMLKHIAKWEGLSINTAKAN